MGRLLIVVTVLGLLNLSAFADNWPAWRGADGLGRSNEKDLPLKWSGATGENIVWKTPLPGPGNSTPIIWGDRIFLTQHTDKGKNRMLMCLSAKDGKLLWKQSIVFDGKEHNYDPRWYCNASPVTDGERVVAFFGSAGMACHDFDGKPLWHRDLGVCDHIWNSASSPVIYGDLVIHNFGPGPRTFLIALDKKTGKDVWKKDIPGGQLGAWGKTDKRVAIGSWSTPVIANIRGRDELIVSWPEYVKAYDPKSGEELWWCTGMDRKDEFHLVYTSPLVGPDAVVAMGGFGGPALAVKPGGKGDVTPTHRLWRLPSAPQRIGSGVLIGEHVYMVNENGTAQCIDVKTGKDLSKHNLNSKFWGSLVHAGDRLYITSTEGETFVLAAKPSFEQLARNPLGDEDTRASAAISNGRIYIRTYQHLWCIGRKEVSINRPRTTDY